MEITKVPTSKLAALGKQYANAEVKHEGAQSGRQIRLMGAFFTEFGSEPKRGSGAAMVAACGQTNGVDNVNKSVVSKVQTVGAFLIANHGVMVDGLTGDSWEALAIDFQGALEKAAEELECSDTVTGVYDALKSERPRKNTDWLALAVQAATNALTNGVDADTLKNVLLDSIEAFEMGDEA